VVNSTGALAGFVAPGVIGWAKQATGRFTAGLLVVAASLLVGSILILLVPGSLETDVPVKDRPRNDRFN